MMMMMMMIMTIMMNETARALKSDVWSSET